MHLHLPDQPAKPRSRLRMPRRTVRLRLTLLYGGLFLVSGAVLLAITYLLSRYVTQSYTQGGGPGTRHLPAMAPVRPAQQYPGNLLIPSGIALAIMAVAAVGLGWLVAGRILRPLRTMTATARQISEDNLNKRLAVHGPSDELKDLSDTIDGLLARLEAAFDAQRRFVANASHEMRTPLTLERAMLEVALADPSATADSLRSTCERVLAVGQQQEHLIDALLTLARSQRGLDHRKPLDLAAVIRQALPARQAGAQRRGVHIQATLSPAPTEGDTRLVEQMMANLLDNAIHHNVPGGWAEVVTGTTAGRATFRVTNSGHPIPADQIQRLLQPFQRLATDRTSRRDGHGLGLSIVQAIAQAHGATLAPRPRPDGGLDVEITFPQPTSTSAPSARR